jgi:hypothetical protein
MAAIFVSGEWLFWRLFLKLFVSLQGLAPAQLPIGALLT